MVVAELEPGDLDDDLPPLVDENGEELPLDVEPSGYPMPQKPAIAAAACAQADAEEAAREREAARTAIALRNAAMAEEAARIAEEKSFSADELMQRAMAEATEPKVAVEKPSDVTMRMITAVSRDDFEECEDAILQGANVNADCGAGMHAIHFAALRGEMFLTELLLAHGADVNRRDMGGNTPLLYACHFYRQHARGVQITAQLLFHRADPHYRVKDGKLAGCSALDLAEKACREPQMDENVPRQMLAMIKLAMEGREECHESITKVWMSFKSQNKKLYQVSSKNDNYNYLMKNISWATPDGAKNAQASTPQRLANETEFILEEKFIDLKDYLFTDEGDKVKVYVTFPEKAAPAFDTKNGLELSLELQSLDLKLRGPFESYRLHIDPLFGSIDVEKCKHRTSATSRKVTLTLAKRHTNRTWPTLQKTR